MNHANCIKKMTKSLTQPQAQRGSNQREHRDGKDQRHEISKINSQNNH